VGVVFDCSGKHGSHKLEKSRMAVASSSYLHPTTSTSAGSIQRRRPDVQPFTTNLEEIQNRLTFTQSRGRTRILATQNCVCRGLGEGQPVLDLLEVRGERLDNLGAVVELTRKVLVVGVGGIENWATAIRDFSSL